MTIWIGIDEKKWKPFFKYMVSEDGDIIGRKLIKPFKDKDGYLRVALHYKGSGKQTKIHLHRLVFMVWKHEIPANMVCCHIDSNILNNHYSNLRVDTQKNNIKDKLKNGTWQAGSTHPGTIYPDEVVLKVQKTIAENPHLKLQALTDIFNPLPKHLIFDIKRGKRKTREQRINDAESLSV